MTARLYDIRQALADAVAKTGVRATPRPTDNTNPPHAIVMRKSTDYDLTMGRGADQHSFSVMVFASRLNERGGDELIDELIDPANPLCLKTIVEGDDALLRLVDYARVRSAGETTVADIASTQYLTVEFDVEVVVSN